MKTKIIEFLIKSTIILLLLSIIEEMFNDGPGFLYGIRDCIAFIPVFLGYNPFDYELFQEPQSLLSLSLFVMGLLTPIMILVVIIVQTITKSSTPDENFDGEEFMRNL